MEIVYFGHSFFEIKTKGGTLIIDPFSKPPQRPDITLITHGHKGHSFEGGENGFVIKAPGEYEIKDIFIIGMESYHDKERGKILGKNIIYLIEAEGIKLCHLGDIGHIPAPEQVEEIGSVDVLFIPVGEKTTIPLKEIPEILSLLEPRIIIPMHYRSRMRGDLEPLEKFLKMMGEEGSSVEKLSLTPSSIPEETKTIPLKPIDL